MKSLFFIFGYVTSVFASCKGEDCPLAKMGRIPSGDRFRCDYRYVPEVEGWMKYHEIPASWHDARLRCHLEGTTLASPLHYALQAAMQAGTGRRGADQRGVFTGIHATFSKGDYFSVEGVPLSQIEHVWAAGEPDNYGDAESCLLLTPDGALADVPCDAPRPYVCYKTFDELEQVNECGTVDSEYRFSNSTGSCYKLHRTPRPWARALMACAAEGGYLAVINSDAEAEVLRRLFIANPPDSMLGDFPKDVAFVGFNDWGEHGEFLTINGQSLAEAGYTKFAPGEPRDNTAGESCGAAHRSALLGGVRCGAPHAFICEKSPASLLCDDDDDYIGNK